MHEVPFDDDLDVSWAFRGTSAYQQAAAEQVQHAWDRGHHVHEQFEAAREHGEVRDIVTLLHEAVTVSETLRACWDQVVLTGNDVLVANVAHMIETLDAVREWIVQQQQMAAYQ